MPLRIIADRAAATALPADRLLERGRVVDRRGALGAHRRGSASLLFGLLVLLSAPACSCGREEPAAPSVPAAAPVPAAPVDDARTSAGTGAAPAGAPTSAPGAATSPTNSPPALVSAEKLKALIPETVGSWKRIELTSVVQATGDGDVLQVNSAFRLGDSSNLVFLSILDTRGFPGPQMTFRSMHDQPNKGITPFEIQGQEGLEQFSARPLATFRMILAARRYLVMISGEGSDQATVRSFQDALDVGSLAALR